MGFKGDIAASLFPGAELHKKRRQKERWVQNLINTAELKPYRVSTGAGDLNWEDGKYTYAPSSDFARLANLLSGGDAAGRVQSLLGGGGSDFAGGAYDMLQKLVAPDQQRRRASTENRLYAQGMLGSTGGAERLGALSQAEQQADTENALRAYDLRDKLLQTELGNFNFARGLFSPTASDIQMSTSILGPQASLFGAKIGGAVGTEANQLEEANLRERFTGKAWKQIMSSIGSFAGGASGSMGGMGGTSGMGGPN